MHKRAMVAGSFDPITKGHVWLIEQALQLAEEVEIVIGVNPSKKYHFPVDERALMISESLSECADAAKRSSIAVLDGDMIAAYAERRNITLFVRGVRNSKDYQYEHDMMCWNRKINPDMTTVLLAPPQELTIVSSSSIKGLVGYGNWEELIADYVHPYVIDQLRDKHVATH